MSIERLAAGLLVLAYAGYASATVWYVDKDNSGTQDGTTWATAYTTIQQGVTAASSGDEVWVAEGVYNEQRTGDTTGALVLKAGVGVYGGFAGKVSGGYETVRTARNWTTHVTTIDGANGRGASTRAYHVVKGATSSTLDGFTVTGGNASGSGWNASGGGFFSDTSGGAIANCIFTSNTASVGGGIATRTSTATFTGCTIYSNTAYSGAGAYNDAGTPVFTNCLFYRNVATNGGGMWNSDNCAATAINCTFTLNQATTGAGICNDTATVTLTNCILYYDVSSEISNTNATTTATYCDVQGGVTGTGNMNQNPVFYDASSNDFRLASGSPCINMGTADNAPGSDIVWATRPQGTAIDIGAYEMVAPVADFSAVPSYGPAALAVQFTDASTTATPVPITQWAWVFGDSGTSPEQSPLHVYGTPGVFAVTLTVTTAVGTSTKTGYVSPLASLDSIQVMDALHVDVLYNGAMGASATTAANYTISGAGKGTLASTPSTVTLVGPNRYRLAWTSGEMVPGGDVTITVANVLDAYGNVLSGFNSATAPGGGIGGSAGISLVTVASGLTVDVTYNRPMGTGATTAANYTLAGGGKGTLSDHPASVALAGSNKYRLTWTSGEMTDRGDITITAASVYDAYGNAIGSYNSGTHAGGAVAVAPRVTAVATQSSTIIDVTFSETMGAGVTSTGNYILSGPGIGTLAPNPASVALSSGNKYRLTWASGEMLNGASVTVTVSGAYDTANNQIAGINNGATHYGGGVGTAPTVSAFSVQSGSSMDITFSELLGDGGLVPTNYIITGTGMGTLNAYPSGVIYVGSNKYRLTWLSGEMFNGGNITATVSGVKDVAGNSIGTSGNVGTSTGGAVGVSPAVLNVAVQTTNAVNILFTESMGTAALTAASYVLSGTGKGSLSNVPSTVTLVGLNTYRLAWSSGEMLNGGNITVTASNVTDLAGNPIGSPASGTSTGGAVATLPSVAMASSASSTTGTSPIPVTATFSESVSGFTAGDVVLGNATITGFSGSGMSYSFGLVPIGEGPVTASIAAGIAVDAAGNTNSAADLFSRTFARTTVTSVNVVYNGMVDVTFSAAMSSDATEAANYTVSGTGIGSLSAHPSSAALLYGNTYRLTWESGEMFDRGNITITVTGAKDAYGNALGSVYMGTHYSGALGISPTVYLSSTADGTTKATPIPVTITFSESVTGFTTDGIAPMNATVQNLHGSGTSYGFDLVPVGSGPVFAQVTAGAAVDAAGNHVAASPMFVRVYDPNPPAVMVTLDDASPTDADSIAFRVTFSEDVGGSFTAGSVTLAGTLASIASLAVTGSSPSFQATVTIADGDANGTIGIHVSPTDIKDAANNACVNEASAYCTVDNTFGFLASPEGDEVYAGEPYTFTVELKAHADPVVLQWKWENSAGVVADVEGQDTTLTLPETNTAQTGKYWCEATYHGVTYTSRKATLTVVALLSITTQPQSAARETGESVTFSVEAVGGVSPLHYTWRKNGVAIANAITSSYTIAATQWDDAAGYTCVVRDDRTQSVTTETALLRLTQAVPAMNMPGLITLIAALVVLAGRVLRRRSRS